MTTRGATARFGLVAASIVLAAPAWADVAPGPSRGDAEHRTLYAVVAGATLLILAIALVLRRMRRRPPTP
jgi:hypothetical protein